MTRYLVTATQIVEADTPDQALTLAHEAQEVFAPSYTEQHAELIA